MALINCSRRLGLLMVAFVILAFDALANEGSSMALRGSPDVTNSRLYGPGDVYANIPVKDEFGRDQLAMFRTWHPELAAAPHRPAGQQTTLGALAPGGVPPGRAGPPSWA